jgi:CheY-like chemotaxis protein
MTHPIAFIVDDDPDFRGALAEVLEDEGYRTVGAENGEVALRLLDSLKPDVILIDLLMPVMNGWSPFATIERRRELRAVPVVFLSAIPQMAPGGGSLILKKPLDLPNLLTLLEALRPAPSSSEFRLQAAPRVAPDYRQGGSKPAK